MPQTTVVPDTHQTQLIAQVKCAQRAGWTDAWRKHCDVEAGGMRDPSRHSAASLERFLQSVSPGESMALVDAAAEPSDQLVEKVKSAQRANQEWKDAWRQRCDLEGGGVYDPGRHERDFLARFLTDHGIDNAG